MDELKRTDSLPSELSVEILFRGALTLEQGESEKVFQLLKKGLENLISARKISNRAAAEFKRLKKQEEKKMEARVVVYEIGVGKYDVEYSRDTGSITDPAISFLRVSSDPRRNTHLPTFGNNSAERKGIESALQEILQRTEKLFPFIPAKGHKEVCIKAAKAGIRLCLTHGFSAGSRAGETSGYAVEVEGDKYVVAYYGPAYNYDGVPMGTRREVVWRQR